ncbi:MAG: hypothetical protein WAT41_09755, partial [Flavobacteriales bacterium]
MRRSGTGPNAYLWRYSLDGSNFNDIGSSVSFTNSASGGVDQATILLSGIPALQAVPAGTSITFRLYTWGGTSLSSTFAFGQLSAGNTANLIAIGGTVTPAVANTSVQFVNSTSSAPENGGTTDLALAITNPGAAATTVTISATDPNGRLTGYSTSVTFPGSSAAEENVVVTPNDNALCDGDEDIAFTITGISGGAGVPTIGANTTNTLTLADDDICNNTTVQFASSTGTVSEGVGSFNALLSITNPSAINNTVVTLGVADPDGRINTFDATVTFQAGSEFDENMNITVADNGICQLDGEVVFTILSVTGGDGPATIGMNNTFTVTITDNDPVATPVATTPAVINSNDFTATWNAAAGATGYELDVSTSPTFSAPGPLTILEEFNDAPVAPLGWTFSGVTAYTTAGSSGLNPNSISFDSNLDAISSPTYSAPAANLSFWIKGNSTNASSALLVEGFNGSSWNTIDNILPLPTTEATKTYTSLIANNYIRFRFTYSKSAGNLAFDDFSINCQCGSTPDFLVGYDPLSVPGTSAPVTGLDPQTHYYYRVRATGGACPTTGNSNTIDVITAAGIDPLLTAGPLANFGARCLGVASEAHSFSLNGVNLTSDVTVGPLDGFSFSTSEFGTYTNSLTLTPVSGSIAEIIWVIFTPTGELAYDGNIDLAGGGAPAITVVASGSGINTAASVTTGSASAIALDQAMVDGTIENGGCSELTSYGIEYSTTSFTPGTGIQVPSTNLDLGEFSSNLTGLDACTMYWFVAYATNNGGTSYGTEKSFTTAAVATPVATTPLVIHNTDFTATWNAVAGATGYRLDVSTDENFGLTSTTVTNGFDSGKAGVGPDGWSHSGLGTDYGSDGGVAAPSLKFDTSTDQLVSPMFPGAATLVSFWYKGQSTASSASALLVEASMNGIAWTSIGSITNIPSSATGTVSIPLLASDGYVQFRFTYTKAIGNLAFDDATVTYVSGTPSYVTGFGDLAVPGTSRSVTGLMPGTEYFYRVRAESPTCPMANSNTVNVTTTGGPCIGNEVILRINTDANAGQISWEIKDAANATVASGSPVGNNSQVDQTLCLSNANGSCYTLKLTDSFG